MPIQQNPPSIARWRRLSLRLMVHLRSAVLQAVCSLWHSHSLRNRAQDCQHDPEFQTSHGNMWAHQTVCDKKKGGCGAITSYAPSLKAIAAREQRQRKKTSSTGNTLEARALRAASDDTTWEGTAYNTCSRCLRGMSPFTTTCGQTILRCEGWNNPDQTLKCTFIKALQGEALPCGPTKKNVPTDISGTSASGSGNKGSSSSRSATSSGKPDKTTVISTADQAKMEREKSCNRTS